MLWSWSRGGAVHSAIDLGGCPSKPTATVENIILEEGLRPTITIHFFTNNRIHPKKTEGDRPCVDHRFDRSATDSRSNAFARM